MTRHNLKVIPEYFKPIVEGIKTFKIRRNDRDYQVGDILVLEEWDYQTKHTPEDT